MGKQSTRSLAEVLRDEMVMSGRIAALLRDGEKTIPELAAALQAPVHEVTLWVMAMVRYGKAAASEISDADGYFRYRLTE